MSEDQTGLTDRAVAAIRARLGKDFPKTAIILGSGWGRFAEKLSNAASMPYVDIPGFSRSTVVGHSGNLVVGDIAGTPLAIMQGRVHGYEGHAPQALAAPIRALRKLGVERLILTNAAGGLKPELPAGTLVIVTDHINFCGFNPLVGPNDESVGPRFPDMTNAYDLELRTQLAEAAREAGVAVKSGVYLFTLGPNFETPAEVRMFARLGGDVVGMSTVPECLVARHCGMKVVGLSLVTNLAAGLSTAPLTHQETIATATNSYEQVEALLLKFFEKNRFGDASNAQLQR
ncbi:MAG: purine-nucleoside phosphorylase [Alphaproteobacteria bacterium]|nr:purine-nucleoside phosphorylase [Alphaproteobacteria bacterium]MDE1987755.1 purine-nucleoside phosphorylase [Alphaproteobacteria bacterium]MDE2164483.1 purine-nucleoside phosphorylase [Alphaproteobacteria bacterium]MDE2498596.1 purine-nucleoside phosphorylase [Alphaproteobacteria bacterium]